MSAPILIVEDNPDDLVFLQRALQSTGRSALFRVVRDGAGAIDYLIGEGEYADRLKHPLPALVLLDLNLPVASGFVVLRWLSEQPLLRRLPVVVFSSSDRDEDVNLAYDLGANAYIVKPNGMKPLGEVVEQVARFWLTLNRRPSLE